MTIVSQKLRDSANRQKTIHAERPAKLPPGRTAKLCACGLWFSLPACHAERHKSCSAACSTERRAVELAKQMVACVECGRMHRPRPNQVASGHGKYCSVPCSLAAVRRTPAFLNSRAKAVETLRKNYQPKLGPANPRWRGGAEATLKRRQENGKAAAQVRRYRSENPHKAREWQQNRKNRRAGHLPYGTLPALMKAQRGKCANCACDIHAKYHVDHIMPLAKGGRHEPENIQLLCGPCNLRKAARHPIAFAQMNGRLL